MEPQLQRLYAAGLRSFEATVTSGRSFVRAGQQCRLRLPDGSQANFTAQTDINSSRVQVLITDRGEGLAWCLSAGRVTDSRLLDYRRERPEDAIAEEILACAPLPITPCGENRLLSNGSLQLLLSENGAISQVLFGGSDWYRPGTPVSDLAIAINGDLDVVSAFTTTATAEVCGDDGRVVAGNFEATIDYEEFPMFREYQLLGNAFRVDTYISNQSSGNALIEMAETFVPSQDLDQGFNLNTQNRLRTIGSNRVVQSTGANTTYTVLMGALEPEAILHDGHSFDTSIFAIGSLGQLRQFLNFPIVSSTAPQTTNNGIHCGIRQTLLPGDCFRFTMLQGFGLTVGQAEQSFLNAIDQL